MNPDIKAGHYLHTSKTPFETVFCLWAESGPILMLAGFCDVTRNFSDGVFTQGSHRLEKYLSLEGFLEKSLKIRSALKSTGKSLKSLEKSLGSTVFCRNWHS